MALSVTCLIPAHNEEETIEWCVRSVQEQDYPVERIIVVADACTDETASIARGLGCDVVETVFKDKAGAQNSVLHTITSDLIVGFDGDTAPAPGCIRLMVEDLEKWDNDATCSTILPAQGSVRPYTEHSLWGKAQAVFFTSSRRFAYSLGRRWWRACQATVGRIQVLTGACYLFRTEALQSTGGFASGLITADMDMTWTFYKHGYKCGYAGNALAYTMDPENFKTYRNQMRRWSSGYFQCMKKHRLQIWNWRSILVVGGAITDMIMLFMFEAAMVMAQVCGWPYSVTILKLFLVWTGIHLVVSTGLAASVCGLKKALIGAVPYIVMNYYNKWLYLCAMIREWALNRPYLSWTGRQGRKVNIAPLSTRRRGVLTLLLTAGTVVSTWIAALSLDKAAAVLGTVVGFLAIIGLWSLPVEDLGEL
jgi:cellulose synthase/poly-beta-1,6-N-acetylglucosamine synthase-like glycosyltransferase